MPELSKTWLNDTTLRVMTYKSGVFTFQVGCDVAALQPMLDRVNDAQHRFNKIPMLPQLVDQMQNRVMASSVYSTNTIEGGQYSEQETANILLLDPATVQRAEERRLTNLKAAIEWVKSKSSHPFMPNSGQLLQRSDIVMLHYVVSKEIDERYNPAGQLRDNQPSQKTLVGDDAHGGAYRPPKCVDDIDYLLNAWLEWLNSPTMMCLPAVMRASLAHYYFELIHPFWDGNGRVGRLVEMLVLEQSGYRFSSSAVWQHYQENLHRYFTLFSNARKAADKKEMYPNQAFVAFGLEGLLTTINRLHDQSNELVGFLLFQTSLVTAKTDKIISDRQFYLVQTYVGLMGALQKPLTAAELYRHPAIFALYASVSERTFYRDIAKLVELAFLHEHEGRLGMGSDEWGRG